MDPAAGRFGGTPLSSRSTIGPSCQRAIIARSAIYPNGAHALGIDAAIE
jgi:hypothetical protein